METTKAHSTGKKDLKDRLKQIGMVAFAILIGLFFVSGYISTQSLGPSQQSPSSATQAPPPTVYGVAKANATILGYNNTLNISIDCTNSTKNLKINAQLSKILTEMESNNTVYNFYSASTNKTLVLSGTMNTSWIFNHISDSLNQSYMSCISFSAPTEILLPPSLNFLISNKTYTIRLLPSQWHLQIIEPVAHNALKTVPIRVFALITANGTVYSLSAAKIK